MIRLAPLAALSLLAASASAFAAPAQPLGQFKQWNAAAYDGDKGKRCYIVSSPSAETPATLRHGDVFFFVQTDLAGATDRITDFELGTDRLAFDFDAASALSYQVGTNEVIVSLKDTGAQVVVLEIDRIDVALIEGGGLL